MIVAKKVKKIMSIGEFAIRLEERGIEGDCLVEQVDCLQQLRFTAGGRTHPEKNVLGASEKVERGQVGGDWLVNGQ